MTLLLDTHVFLWWLDDASILSSAARDAIGDGKNTVNLTEKPSACEGRRVTL